MLGVHAVRGELDAFIWRLNAEHATDFADRIDALAMPSRIAGSDVLACSQEEEAIPVKVSCGEYTDDFLR